MQRWQVKNLGVTWHGKELDTPSRKRKSTQFVEYLKQKEE